MPAAVRDGSSVQGHRASPALLGCCSAVGFTWDKGLWGAQCSQLNLSSHKCRKQQIMLVFQKPVM